MFCSKLYFEYLECARPGALRASHNIKNVPFRNTGLHNAEKAIYFTTPKNTFIKD